MKKINKARQAAERSVRDLVAEDGNMKHVSKLMTFIQRLDKINFRNDFETEVGEKMLDKTVSFLEKKKYAEAINITSAFTVTFCRYAVETIEI